MYLSPTTKHVSTDIKIFIPLQLLQTQAAHLSLSWVVLKVPLQRLDIIQLCSLGLIFFAEVIHPLVLGGKYSHLPFLHLMAISVVCAYWLVLCWVGCLYEIMRPHHSAAINNMKHGLMNNVGAS